MRTIRVRQYTGVIYDLLKAYAEQRGAPPSACTSCTAHGVVHQERANGSRR